MANALGEPLIYVRGPLAALADSAKFRETIAESPGDAFALCLLDPPTMRSESSLLRKAPAALRGSDSPGMNRIERLFPLEASLPFFRAEWRTNAERADETTLAKLSQQLNRVPIAVARRALLAEHLLFALDEPGDTAAPAELDGERPHFVRVELVALGTERSLLRLRLRVDPSRISTATHAE